MTLTDPLARPPGHDPSPDWSQSLAGGAAGIALLHIVHARDGVGDWGTAHQWVTAMIRSPVVADPDACGLFRGAPAVAFVLRVAARPEHGAWLRTLNGHVTALTRQRLDRAHERIERGQLPELREFDLINGLTGIGVYLLQANDTDPLRGFCPTWSACCGTGDPRRPAAAGMVDQPRTRRPALSRVAGWPQQPGPRPRHRGPLALLATAMRLGVTVPGHAEAINRICAELDQWRCGIPGRSWWPGMISPAEWKTRAVGQPGPQRPSWCYGVPGMVLAQQLAALALGDRRRQHQAENA